MTTNEKILNEKICKWLGLEIFTAHFEKDILVVYKDNKRIILDFLHDRNQQKWIEDELEKNGYVIFYEFIAEWKIEIIKNEIDIVIYNKSKDLAFIQVIEQLIDKENKEETK